MIRTFRKYSFKFLDLVLEPAEVVAYELERASKYNRVSIYSYYELELPKHFRLVGFRETPVIQVHNLTIDHVFARFRKTVRNEVRRSIEHDQTSCTIDGAISDSVYDIYCRFETAQNRKPKPRIDFMDLKIATAQVGTETLSCIAWYTTGQVLRVHSIFSTRLDREREIDSALVSRSSKRLVYELCKYACANDCVFVDLAYINRANMERQGINAYKMGFGSEIFREYQYVYEDMRYTIFARIMKVIRIMRSAFVGSF